MQLKLRHLLLFAIACTVLIFADLPGGALLGLAALMQLVLLVRRIPLTRQSQIGALKLFLISVPLVFFWGGVHSFVTIYWSENQFVFLLMALTITAALTFLVSLQLVFSYYFLQRNNYELFATLNDAFNNIKTRRREYLQMTGLVFLFSFIPWFSVDWKLVFALMATHLFLERSQTKTALADF